MATASLPRSDLQGCARAIEREARRIIATGAHLVTLGGDHFITLPLLRAHAARHGKLALVQFDAHQDTWDDGVGAYRTARSCWTRVREGLIDRRALDPDRHPHRRAARLRHRDARRL